MANPRADDQSPGLLEREHELEALERTVLAAQGGQGGVVVIEGPPGMGKTSLLSVAASMAGALGIDVLTARGDVYLSLSPWSVAIELLGPVLAGRSRQERARLLSGAAAPARRLFSHRAASGGSPGPALEEAIARALYWLLSAMSERAPLVLIVDDAQWADPSSLQFLAHASSRVADLPLVLLIARRRREPGQTGRELLDRVGSGLGSVLLQIPALSADASALLVRRTLGEDSSDELAEACAEATGGNPFYLNQLLVEVANQRVTGGALDPSRIRTLTPSSVWRAVLVRLARLGPEAMALAEAVAVLGDQCGFPLAAELAGLEHVQAAMAFDALSAAEILRPGEPLGFVHPLVASAIHSEIPAGRRGEAHLRAARLLADAGEAPQLVAVQLLYAGRRGERWVVDALRAAARTALQRGAAAAAADYLARALEEPPAPGRRAAVLGELARAEAAAGREQAVARFEALMEVVADRGERARIHLELGRVLSARGRHGEALDAFQRGLTEQGSELDDTGRELRAAYWSAKTMTRQMKPEELGQLQQLVAEELQDPTPGERALLAALATGSAFQCQPREQVLELARRAWGDGTLLDVETSNGISWTLVTGALLHADELEFELQICEQALADAHRRGSRQAFATASFIRSGVLDQMGHNDEAIADAEAALAARDDGWSQYLGTALGNLAAVLRQRGDVQGAHRVLGIAEEDPALADSIENTVILVRRGELLLQEGHPAEALDRLETAGRILTQMFDFVMWAPWRPGAVRALLALDRRSRAHELAEELVELTRRLGAPSALAMGLRTLAQTEPGGRGLELLEEAVGLFEKTPQRREHAYALVEYGAALRRAGHRAAAGDPLRLGLGLAERGGLRALAAQAVAELAAAGARTRRHTLSGVESLTPTEGRVVKLAADDLSNREIAQQLFVTVKTVEYHLANAYRKLDVRSRTGLAAALASEQDAEDRRGLPTGA